MGWRVRAGALVNPAAGAGFTMTPNNAGSSKLRALLFTLTTDITVANREIVVQLLDQSGNLGFQANASAVQAASATVTYEVSDAFAAPFATPAIAGIGWPDMWMPAGWQVKVTAALEDTGDQFSAITYLVEYGWPGWEIDEAAQAAAQLGLGM